MIALTLKTMHRYWDKDALFGIPQYGVFWLMIAAFSLGSLTYQPAIGIPIILYIGLIAGMMIVKGWTELAKGQSQLLVPGFRHIHNLSLWLWLGLFALLVIGLLLYAGISPVPATAMCLYTLGSGPFMKPGRENYWAPPNLLLPLPIILLMIGLLVHVPSGLGDIVRQGGYWVIPVFACDAIFVALLIQRIGGRRDTTVKTSKTNTSNKVRKVFDWRLGQNLSTLPLPPYQCASGLIVLVLFMLVGACIFLLTGTLSASVHNTFDIRRSSLAIVALGATFWCAIKTLKAFTQLRPSWPRLWLITQGSNRSHFAHWLVGGILLELAIDWINLVIAFIIASQILLQETSLLLYIAAPIGSAVFFLYATAIVLLPACWRDRGSALIKSTVQVVVGFLGALTALVCAGLVHGTMANNPLAITVGYLIATAIAGLILVFAIRGLKHMDF